MADKVDYTKALDPYRATRGELVRAEATTEKPAPVTR